MSRVTALVRAVCVVGALFFWTTVLVAVPVRLLVSNGDVETAVGHHAGRGRAVARQRCANEQCRARGGGFRVTRAVAGHFHSRAVLADEGGERMTSARGDCIYKDRDGPPRARGDGQAGCDLRAALDAVRRVGHDAVGRDRHALEIGQVLIGKPELQGVDVADRDAIDEGHVDRDGLGIRGQKTGREQKPDDDGGHARYPAISELSKLVHK